MIGVNALRDFGIVNLHIKPTVLGAKVVGASIFGAVMLLLVWMDRIDR